MYKLKFMIIFKTQNKNNSLTGQIFFHPQITPLSMHSEERLVNSVRGRECVVGLYHIISWWTRVREVPSSPYPRKCQPAILKIPENPGYGVVIPFNTVWGKIYFSQRSWGNLLLANAMMLCFMFTVLVILLVKCTSWCL